MDDLYSVSTLETIKGLVKNSNLYPCIEEEVDTVIALLIERGFLLPSRREKLSIST